MIPLTVECEGPLHIVGPTIIAAEGGMTGTYIETTGIKGRGRVMIKGEGLEPAVIDLEVE